MATCQATTIEIMTTWKPSNMAATETLYWKEACRLFVSRVGIGLKSHPARVGLPVILYQSLYVIQTGDGCISWVILRGEDVKTCL